MIFIQKIFIFIIVFSIIVCVFFIPIFNNSESFNSNEFNQIIDFDSTDGFLWPAPGYTRINSYFGKRNAPTSGASTIHKGIDIGAPQGSKFIAVTDADVTFTNFFGGGGYTITITTGNMKISYCHCSPNYIVKVGDKVKKGQIIGEVGPKNVYGVPGNTYKDSNGNPTNGATTGPHLHFGIRVNNNYVNPLNYY